MSTVVLTPTHIACDHNVVHTQYPFRAEIDINYKKIFVDPKKKFLFATVGEFYPHDMETPETFDSIREMIIELTMLRTFIGSNTMAFTREEPFVHFGNVADPTGRTFIVTKTSRYMVFKIEKSKRWAAKIVGPFSGTGSGGMLAVGLLKGGLKLADIWEPLSELDPHSSVEHTSIPLSILKPWKI